MTVFLTIVAMETQQYVTLYCCWLTHVAVNYTQQLGFEMEATMRSLRTAVEISII